jgi:RHS repeat-associated protein
LPAASDRPDRSTPSGSPPADTSAPYVPTDLAGTIVAAGRIDLAWSPSSDDVAIAGYNLYRDGLKINTVPIGSTAYSDTGLTPGVSHTYTVTAIDAAANEGAPSSGWSGAASDGALLTAYAYDAENRLTGIESGSETLGTYAYDGAGDRVAKTVSGSTTAYTLDLASGLPQVLSETALTATTSYAYGGGPLEFDRSGSTYWYLADTLGSVRLVTDASGDTPATYAYAAFGSTRAETGSLANEVRFTGERTDTESGLEFLRARTYDPSTGTFLQRDTVAITPTASQSIDAYVYTANNPVNAVDPSGHMARVYDEGPVSHGNLHAGSSAYTKPIKAMTAAEKGDLMPGGSASSNPASSKSTSIATLGHGYTGTTDQADCGWNPLCLAGSGYAQVVGNNLVNKPADFLHNSAGLSYSATVGGCVGRNFRVGPVDLSPGAICVMATTDGQLAVAYNPGFSFGYGLDVGPFVSVFASTGGSAGDQEDAFFGFGGGDREVLGGQGQVAVGQGRCGQPVLNLSGGPSVGVGGKVEGGVTYTTILWRSKEDKPCPAGAFGTLMP